jgi:hypothetical protein
MFYKSSSENLHSHSCLNEIALSKEPQIKLFTIYVSSFLPICSTKVKKKKNSVAFSPQANYANRATAAFREVSDKFCG